MDAELNRHFQRVEAALATLVDSIAAYNPSPQAATELIAADEHLARALDQLAQHQANHARIQALRAEAGALEGQLKSSVAALASLRRELFETPATTFAENSRPVPFDELLQYAKNISKYTVPPTYRERIPPPQKDGEDGGTSGTATNALNTPAAASVAAPPGAQELPAEGSQGEKEGPKDITAEEAEWLRKLNESQMPWFPWPNADKIRQGNLMRIQYELDQGNDPMYIDIAGRAEGEKQKAEETGQGIPHETSLDAPTQLKKPTETAPPVAAPALSQPSADAGSKVYTGFDFMEDDEE